MENLKNILEGKSARDVLMEREYVQKWRVPGSASEPYTVSKTSDGDYECSCKGWTLHVPRKDCKHIRAVKGTGETIDGIREVNPQLTARDFR